VTIQPTILINGRPDTAVSPLDRGFAYGDGLFRTICVNGGHPSLWSRHIQHLDEGSRRLGIPVIDPVLLAEEAGLLFADGGDGVLKIVVTRGVGGRGYRPPDAPAPTRLLMRFPLPPAPPSVAKVRLCQTRVSTQPATAGIKTLNRLDQVLARSEWSEAETFEGMMLDNEGFVVGGTMSNLFIVLHGRLYTPLIDRAGIRGAMRAAVLDVARSLGIEPYETRLSASALAGAEEAFLTNSVMGIVPIGDLLGRVLGIGPVARRIQEGIAAEIEFSRKSGWQIG
jgi:4-amino-4-deoxychorismate lyase